MRVLDLRQGSPEWHRWRAGGVGASDAPAVMGCHVAGLTADELLAEKLGRAKREQTYAMRRGLWSESPALRLFQERTGWLVRPACVQHPETPWLRASLDGLTLLADAAAEVKAPRVVEHEIALGGVVPRCYWPQVQHQLLMPGLELVWYVSYSVARRFGGPESPSLAVVEVEADAEYQSALLAAEEAFWGRLCRAWDGQRAVV